MLELEKISLDLGQRRILHEVSLHVEAGECLGIIGPNGSGKSTLLQAILGYLPLSEGRIKLQGRNLSDIQPRERARQMAYVAQDSLSALPFTVESFLQLAYFPWQETLDYAAWEDDCLRICREFQLLDKMGRKLDTLSGGESQRVILVQSLLQRPQLLLLDEITNHLDIGYQLETLEYLSRQSISRIMVLHDINLAAQFCDRLIFLKEGRRIQAETITEELLQELFGVPCEIIQSSRGGRHIVFGRSRWSGRL